MCIQCNRVDIAQQYLINRPPWAHMPPAVNHVIQNGGKNKLQYLLQAPYSAFAAALIFPGREAFVEAFLQQRFPIRRFTSYLDVLLLYRKAVGKEFFTALVWDDILGHNQGIKNGTENSTRYTLVVLSIRMRESTLLQETWYEKNSFSSN